MLNEFSMKKICFIITLFVGAASLAQAQNSNEPTKMVAVDNAATDKAAEKKTDELDRIVSLNRSQRQTILEGNKIFEEKYAYMKASGQETEKALSDLESARMQLYNTYLSEEQIIKLKQSFKK